MIFAQEPTRGAVYLHNSVIMMSLEMYCILSRSEGCNLGSFNILKFQPQSEMLITNPSSRKVLFLAKVVFFVVMEGSLSG